LRKINNDFIVQFSQKLTNKAFKKLIKKALENAQKNSPKIPYNKFDHDEK
jgi:hypothetical protein